MPSHRDSRYEPYQEPRYDSRYHARHESHPAPRHRKKRRKKRPLLTLLFVVLVLFAAGRALFQEPEQTLEKPVTAPTPAEEVTGPAVSVVDVELNHYQRKDNFYTILVSGVDYANGGSDTNILVAVDAGEGKVYGVSIPRDSKAYVNGKAHKINAAYAFHGMEGISQVVSTQLGIPVDYTVKVDLKAFVALVDAIDGVDFNVPINMDYDDPFQDLEIHFQKGMQHLTGEEAIKVVRFRHNNDGTGYGSEDIGRMQTQQEFLKTVAKKLLTVDNLKNVDEFVRIFKSYVETDLSIGNLAWLGKTVMQIGSENIDFSTLPGEWKSPYIYLDQTAVLEVLNQHLNPYTEPRTLDDLNIPS